MTKNATLYRESQFAAICEAIAGRAIAATRLASGRLPEII